MNLQLFTRFLHFQCKATEITPSPSPFLWIFEYETISTLPYVAYHFVHYLSWIHLLQQRNDSHPINQPQIMISDSFAKQTNSIRAKFSRKLEKTNHANIFNEWEVWKQWSTVRRPINVSSLLFSASAFYAKMHADVSFHGRKIETSVVIIRRNNNVVRCVWVRIVNANHTHEPLERASPEFGHVTIQMLMQMHQKQLLWEMACKQFLRISNSFSSKCISSNGNSVYGAHRTWLQTFRSSVWKCSLEIAWNVKRSIWTAKC